MPRATSKKPTTPKKKTPKATPARLPEGYVPKGTQRKLLPWSFADTRLRRSHNYWICTTRKDGRPHAAPVWGVWLGGAFYFSTDPSSVKAKNLARNPAIVVHLESGDETVIAEGQVETCEVSKAIDAAYFRKYAIHLIGFDAPMGMYCLKPQVVQAWREKDFTKSATRFELR